MVWVSLEVRVIHCYTSSAKTPWTFENDHGKILYLNDMRLIDEQN